MARRDEDVLVLVSVAADAPHAQLTPFLAQSYSNYPTYDYLLQTADTAYQRRILTVLYREIIFPVMQENATGVCILAVGRSCGTVMGGLFISTRSFETTVAHGLSDPAETYGKIWRDVWLAEPTRHPVGADAAPCTQTRIGVLCRAVATVWLACCIGPFALRRLLRYSSRGRELNRQFACALAGGASGAPVPMWRIDHLFVRPEYRRAGLCRRLIHAAIDGADEASAVLYLSTSAAVNVPMYQKLGFHVVGAATSAGRETFVDAANAERLLQERLVDVGRIGGGRLGGLMTTGMARAPRGRRVPSIAPESRGGQNKSTSKSKRRGGGAVGLLLDASMSVCRQHHSQHQDAVETDSMRLVACVVMLGAGLVWRCTRK